MLATERQTDGDMNTTNPQTAIPLKPVQNLSVDHRTDLKKYLVIMMSESEKFKTLFAYIKTLKDFL